MCVLAACLGLVTWCTSTPSYRPALKIQFMKPGVHRRSTACSREDHLIAEKAIFSDAEAVQKVLRSLSESENPGSWLQIGANTLHPEGNENDPFLKALPSFSGYQKYFVEPIPSIFKQLQSNVAQMPNATAINVAILPSDEVKESSVDMYCAAETDWDSTWWANQVCSFREEHITKHSFNSTVKIQVVGLSLSELLRRHKIQDVKVLMIDVEGFDYTVVKQLPFHDSSFRPNLIAFESWHLSESEKVAGIEILRQQCYLIFHDQANVANVFALAV